MKLAMSKRVRYNQGKTREIHANVRSIMNKVNAIGDYAVNW